MQPPSFSGVDIHIRTHKSQVTIYWRVKMTDIHTPIPTLDLAYTNTYTSGCASLLHFQERFHYTHKQLPTGGLVDDYRRIHASIPTLDCLRKHTFLSHAYRSVFLVRMQRYTQLAYSFHPCGTSLGRDGRIADCTVRHPSVQRPFSEVLCSFVFLRTFKSICTILFILSKHGRNIAFYAPF